MTTDATTPTQTTDRGLWDLGARLNLAAEKAQPGYRVYAAAQEADRWARERYEASTELLRQHREDDRLRELLAALEWSGQCSLSFRADGVLNIRSVRGCPSCGGPLPSEIWHHTHWPDLFEWGHRPDCALKAALEGREEVGGELSDDETNSDTDTADGDPHVIAKHRVDLGGNVYESSYYLVGPRRRHVHQAGEDLQRWTDAGNEADDYDAALDQYVESLQDRIAEQGELMEASARRAAENADRAATLADRVMVAEGERDRLQGRLANLTLAADKLELQLRETREALGTYVNTARTMSGEYEQRIAELEAQVPEWQEAVDEASAEAQNYHRLYADQVGENMRLEARLADYDHQAEQAETYRRLYAQTLKCLQDYALTLESAVSLLR